VIKTILETLRDNLGDSATLKAWSQSNYGKDHNVFLGYNPESPPSESLWPAIVIAKVSLAERARSRKTFRILIGYFIGDSNTTTSDNKITYSGFLNSEIFRETAEDVIMVSRKTLGKINIIDAGTFENLVFPLFTTTSLIEVEDIWSSQSSNP